jgi:hypothetical protein
MWMSISCINQNVVDMTLMLKKHQSHAYRCGNDATMML